MKKTIAVLLVILFLFLSLFFIRFGSVLTQEGNPFPILTAILSLELSNKEFKLITEESSEKRFVSKHGGKIPYKIPIEYIEGQGWTYKEQMGSGLIFEKHNEQIVIETRQFTSRYYLWDVPDEVVE